MQDKDEAAAKKKTGVTHTLLDWALLAQILQLLSQYFHGVNCPVSSVITDELAKEIGEEETLGKETGTVIGDLIATKGHFDDKATLTIDLTIKQAEIVAKYHPLIEKTFKKWSVRKEQLVDHGAK